MRHWHASWPAAIAGVALALLLAAPGIGAARKLQMSETWALRTVQLFVPFHSARPTHCASHTSMGDLSQAFAFPWSPISGMGAIIPSGNGPVGP